MGRKKIALTFTYSENWIGGTYYILNLICALKTLKKEEQPEITILHHKDGNLNEVKKIDYPYINFEEVIINSSFPARFLRYFVRKIFKLEIFKPFLKTLHQEKKYFDVIFPSSHTFDGVAQRNINWIPDFQEKYLPQFFSKKIVEDRFKVQKQLSISNEEVVFSSKDAQNDFNKFFPNNNAKQYVVRFAVTHPDISDALFENIRQKYSLPKKYFFCPNQFWAHKNHILIFEALKYIRDNNLGNIDIVFSGQTNDYRNPEFYPNLMQFIKTNDLSKNIHLLGFIDRKDQLLILKNSIAVIQPSLFEGWSTVVEDSKAQNHNIIASNIMVHKEQLGQENIFFDPTNKEELSNILLNYEYQSVSQNYTKNIYTFAEDFIKII